MAHKDKGRKGDKDKGKGKKRDRAKNEASTAIPVVAAEPPKAQAAPRAVAAPRVGPKPNRPRPVTPPRVATSTSQPAKVERAALPTDRASLLALHQAARRERDGAPRLSRERAEASFEIERIEVQIARVERAMDPPLV